MNEPYQPGGDDDVALLTMAQAAEYAKNTPDAVRTWTRRYPGQLPSELFGPIRVVRRRDLHRFLVQREMNGGRNRSDR